MGELATKVTDSLKALMELQIITLVGKVTVSNAFDPDNRNIEIAEDQRAMITSINLVQGDITNGLDESFAPGNEDALREFHERQVIRLVEDGAPDSVDATCAQAEFPFDGPVPVSGDNHIQCKAFSRIKLFDSVCKIDSKLLAFARLAVLADRVFDNGDQLVVAIRLFKNVIHPLFHCFDRRCNREIAANQDERMRAPVFSEETMQADPVNPAKSVICNNAPQA